MDRYHSAAGKASSSKLRASRLAVRPGPAGASTQGRTDYTTALSASILSLCKRRRALYSSTDIQGSTGPRTSLFHSAYLQAVALKPDNAPSRLHDRTTTNDYLYIFVPDLFNKIWLKLLHPRFCCPCFDPLRVFSLPLPPSTSLSLSLSLSLSRFFFIVGYPLTLYFILSLLFSSLSLPPSLSLFYSLCCFSLLSVFLLPCFNSSTSLFFPFSFSFPFSFAFSLSLSIFLYCFPLTSSAFLSFPLSLSLSLVSFYSFLLSYILTCFFFYHTFPIMYLPLSIPYSISPSLIIFYLSLPPFLLINSVLFFSTSLSSILLSNILSISFKLSFSFSFSTSLSHQVFFVSLSPIS
ncbi:unnamed protein product [Acanthosepion pharaonis]|uniref:Uncharacterized protein n=1 Tax=Acanthosepion pharaonis TaxID=158019 RepID=A0A812CV20_ACAPH|nr:unnamed protein product [Sepia pharaonis]